MAGLQATHGFSPFQTGLDGPRHPLVALGNVFQLLFSEQQLVDDHPIATWALHLHTQDGHGCCACIVVVSSTRIEGQPSTHLDNPCGLRPLPPAALVATATLKPFTPHHFPYVLVVPGVLANLAPPVRVQWQLPLLLMIAPPSAF